MSAMPQHPVPTRGRVLVVDGEAGGRESLRMLLEPLYAVAMAATAAEAREQIAAGSVDIVTLELRLPGAPGEDLLVELRERHPEIGVVVITSRASVASATLALRAGAIDYLEKPFDVAAVRCAVARGLARRTTPDPDAFLAVLAATIEAQHPFLAGHAQRTALYADLLAERLLLPAEEREHVRLAALLHDVGKIGVPTRLLMRAQALTGAERARIEQHSEIGARLVAPLGLAPAVAAAVRHHHERWGGGGYPCGLAGEAIPVTARIVALADAWDAMSSDRPYRRGLAPERVRAEIERCAGSQFDPLLAKEFLALFEASEVEPELLADALTAAGLGAWPRGGVNRW
jgi:putative nucleotidyltransferase with HDIG domain